VDIVDSAEPTLRERVLCNFLVVDSYEYLADYYDLESLKEFVDRSTQQITLVAE
jgi:hypothetical protein